MLIRKYGIVLAPDGPTGGGNAPADTSAGSTTSSPEPSSTPAPGPSGAPSTPTPAPSAAPEEAASPDSGVDFNFLFGQDQEEVSPAPVSPPPATPTPKPAGDEPAPAPATAKPGEPATPAPATPGPTETPSAPTPTPEPAQLDPYDPGALAKHLKDNEEAAVKHIADTLFKLSPEEIEALESDTVGTVPKLLAKSFVMAQQNMLQQLSRLVPAMMTKHTTVMKRHSDNEAKFYSRWPDLKADKHGDLVRQYGAVYRQMNPQATLEKMIEDLGPMVMMRAGVTPTLPGATPAQTPAASPMTNGVRPPQPSAFQPAAPLGGGAAVPQAQAPGHPVNVLFDPRNDE